MEQMSDFELDSLCKKYKKLDKYRLDKKYYFDAGKINVLETILKDKQNRVLIFSQFVIMLDILEPVLKEWNINYIRLDGSTPREERQRLIDSFQNDDSIFVFLLSTKAGGFGINLTRANVVVLYDIDFNPHNDKQAEDRAHRVGQTRDVNVFRLITTNSVEERIYQSAQRKLELDTFVSRVEKDTESDIEWLQEMINLA